MSGPAIGGLDMTTDSGVSPGGARRSYRWGVEWNCGQRLEADDTAPPRGMLFKGEMRF